MCSLSGLFGPLCFYLRCFDPLHRYWWWLLKCSLARTKTQEDRKKEREERVTGWVGETEGGKKSLQGKWMVGMCAEAQWMSCTLGWGGLQVLCWGSRSQSGCDWHQKQHFMAGNTVAGRRRTNRTFSINRLISYAVVDVFVLRALKEHDSLTNTLLQLITVYRQAMMSVMVEMSSHIHWETHVPSCTVLQHLNHWKWLFCTFQPLPSHFHSPLPTYRCPLIAG